MPSAARGKSRFSLKRTRRRRFPRAGPRCALIMALPGVAQRGDARELPHALGHLGRVEDVEQDKPILPHRLGVGVAVGLPLRQARILDPLAIALVPLKGRQPLQPGGGDRRQLVESGPQRLCHQFQPVEHPDRRQDMGRVGALLATGFEQAQGPTALQELLEQSASAALPARRRSRNSLSTEKSKPGSVNSSPKRYFQSIRARTASAAWRSARFSRNCMIVTRASRQGAALGSPRRETARQSRRPGKWCPSDPAASDKDSLWERRHAATRAVCSGLAPMG